MRGHVISIRRRREQTQLSLGASRALYLLSSCFFAGSLLGCLLSGRICGGSEALLAYLKQYLTAAQVGRLNGPEIAAAVWHVFRYPAACFFLHFVGAGRWMIPGLLALRGFFLSFAVSAFVRLFGISGLGLAAGAFLPSAAMELICMLLWGLQKLSGKGETPSVRRSLPLCGICIGLLLCAVAYECCFAPSVLGILSASVLN